MSKENGIDFLKWQKKNLEKEEIEEIYDKPKNPEREFEGVDEDENNKEAVPEKSKDEKIEEELLKGEDKKRRGESTEIENKIEDDSKDDTKKQFKIGKKKIAEVKRGQVEESLEKTEPETIESVQEPEVKNEKLETIREKTAGEGKELENLIKTLEGIATTCKTLEDAKEGKIKTQNSEEGINNNIESLVNSVMKNRNTGEIEKIMNNSEMNDEQKDYIRKAIGKYGMEIGKGTEKASVETSIDDYFKNCKEDGIKLRIEEGEEKTFVITKIPKKGNIILKNTEAENKKEVRLNKEFLYELNNVKISRENLANSEEIIEEKWNELENNFRISMKEWFIEEYSKIDEAGKEEFIDKERKGLIFDDMITEIKDSLAMFSLDSESEENQKKFFGLYKNIALEVLGELEKETKDVIEDREKPYIFTEKLNYIKKEIEKLDFEKDKDREASDNFIKKLEEYKSSIEIIVKKEGIPRGEMLSYLQIIKEITKTIDEIKDKIKQAEIRQKSGSKEPEIENMLKDVPNAEDFKISLKEKGAERKEEIRGAEAEEIPDIKSEEEIEAMSLEELDEEIKKMSEYLEKMEEKAKSMGIEDISKSHTYQEFEEYLDDLENAKKIKEEAKEEKPVEPEKEPKKEPKKEPEKIELNEAEKEYIRKTKEIEKLRKENEGLLSIPWEDLTEEEKEIVERIEELEIGRVVDKGSATMTNHIDELERKVGTPKEKKGILEAQKEYIESKKLLIGVEMLEKGLRMKMERSKKRRKLFPSVGKIGSAVTGKFKNLLGRGKKERIVKATSKVNIRFEKEKRKNLSSISEQGLKDEFNKVSRDIIDLADASNKKTEKIIKNVYRIDIKEILKKINTRDRIKDDHDDIKENFKEARRRIGELPNDLNNPKEYLNEILSKVNDIFREKIGESGGGTAGSASGSSSESETLQNFENEEDKKKELLENLKNEIKKDLEKMEDKKLEKLKQIIFAVKFSGRIEDNTSVKKLIDELQSYETTTEIKDTTDWIEKYKDKSETGNIKLKDIEEIIDDIKRSRV